MDRYSVESPIGADRRTQTSWGPVKADEIVKLNVGGKVFVSTRSTLTKQPDSMLAVMFGGTFKEAVDKAEIREILTEAEYYLIPDLIDLLQRRLSPLFRMKEYATIRYMPGTTYDGWPMRLEGPIDRALIMVLNGGDSMPPETEHNVKNMYGNAMMGWKLRGTFLTKVLNSFAEFGWVLDNTNGSGAGGTLTDPTKSFAEMYVFSREREHTVTSRPTFHHVPERLQTLGVKDEKMIDNSGILVKMNRFDKELKQLKQRVAMLEGKPSKASDDEGEGLRYTKKKGRQTAKHSSTGD